MTFSPTDFWNRKILTWEHGRYFDGGADQSWLERLANKSSNSLRFRIAVTRELLAPHVRGKKILEIGCGSGLLAADLIKFGAECYRGVDIAETAIESAKARLGESPDTLPVSFEVGSIQNMSWGDADLVFSLGLLDWLNDEELEILFKNQNGADYLHAISERRISLQQYLHQVYVYLSYGFKTQGYRPRYFSAAKIKELSDRYGDTDVYVYRSPKLSFGALLSSLPVGEKLG